MNRIVQATILFLAALGFGVLGILVVFSSAAFGQPTQYPTILIACPTERAAEAQAEHLLAGHMTTTTVCRALRPPIYVETVDDHEPALGPFLDRDGDRFAVYRVAPDDRPPVWVFVWHVPDPGPPPPPEA